MTCAPPALWVVGVLAWERYAPSGTQLIQLLAATPAIACAGTGHRRGVVVGGACALFALYPLGGVGAYEDLGSRAGTCLAILSVVVAGYLAAGRRARLTHELVRVREVAAVTQRALLRPPPARAGEFTLAAGHLSASRHAALGGDLYDAVPTAYGLRLVIGDVRGHGLPAVATVAALLGTFREAAHDEPDLAGVLRRLERGLERHLSGTGCRDAGVEPLAEEFVTVLLLEARADGSFAALNCGHPWPYHLAPAAARAGPVAEAEPLPPLGLFPLPVPLPRPSVLPLPPGDVLLLHTDGAEDARDAAGGAFDLAGALREVLAPGPADSGEGRAPDPAHPAEVVHRVRAALLRHSGGRLSDDVALFAVRRERGHGPPGEPGRECGKASCTAGNRRPPCGPADRRRPCAGAAPERRTAAP
ncbi:serine/threonine-protein phosphatase [Streptomyces sp. AJS327]|uniref:PP2C family protein-serine/threonine phosphatase n=1 Tax=Streptomyces sp. AJS327 TaxID=2545265 RepID=UPI0015DE09A3|nr:PP2C family protein-serine/threonine phosphatase [Streptomyces sp. AJS327]MBA0050734.1 serine/threonine-protein phosphatase [Streptomyces sp. AJS327]